MSNATSTVRADDPILTRYRVVESHSPEKLAELVGYMEAEGWRPVGGVAVRPHGKYHTEGYFQGMVKTPVLDETLPEKRPAQPFNASKLIATLCFVSLIVTIWMIVLAGGLTWVTAGAAVAWLLIGSCTAANAGERPGRTVQRPLAKNSARPAGK